MVCVGQEKLSSQMSQKKLNCSISETYHFGVCNANISFSAITVAKSDMLTLPHRHTVGVELDVVNIGVPRGVKGHAPPGIIFPHLQQLYSLFISSYL